MRVILTESVEKLGVIGDVVDVAPGYGRNYLLPKQLALLADKKNVRRLEHQKRMLEQKRQKQLLEAKDFASRLEAAQITITRKAGENEKLFGSVTNQDIQEALKSEGIEIDRKLIHLEEPIKTLGYFTIAVKVEKEVEAALKLWVVGEE